jgi:hypothetical protein
MNDQLFRQVDSLLSMVSSRAWKASADSAFSDKDVQGI